MRFRALQRGCVGFPRPYSGGSAGLDCDRRWRKPGRSVAIAGPLAEHGALPPAAYFREDRGEPAVRAGPVGEQDELCVWPTQREHRNARARSLKTARAGILWLIRRPLAAQ